tara:strand:+ start:18 stop:581 length:564 start_codon:yes stop_codon:yes gene_type:complete
MNISSIRLKQTLAARVASTGLQSSIPIGGTASTALTSDDADIIYGFSITSGHASNAVKWTLDTHTLQQTDANTAPTSTEAIGTSGGSAADILDADGEAVPDANLALAIYYEIPSTTTTDAWVQAVGTSADQANVFSTVKLVGHTGSSTGSRSALLVPRAGCNSDYITFTFNAVGVKINVVYLANTTS